MLKPLFHFCYLMSARLWPALTFRLRLESDVTGVEGPILVLAKHASYWDIPMVSRGVHHACSGKFPHFEMASFHGYIGLEQLTWFLELNGAFPVMRPKDLIRLKRKGKKTKEELVHLMSAVNEKAAATRLSLYNKKEVVCYFPEGTREMDRVLKLRSLHEIEEAEAFREETGTAVTYLPVLPCYGKKNGLFRRRCVVIRVLEPLVIAGQSPAEILAMAQLLFEKHWLSPDEVDASFER